MDERRALMAAIIANPDEDTPRLALADWLDEHGDEHDRARAEFIRLQVQAEKLPNGGAARKKLDASADKLAAKHRSAWLAPLVPFESSVVGFPPSQIDFRRGLLKYLMVRTGEFLQKANQQTFPEALAAVGVEELHFYSATARVAALAAAPAIRWTAGLTLPGPDDAALAAFGASPEWRHLSSMAFDEVKATDAGLKALAKTAGQTGLRRFGLSVDAGLSKLRGKYTAGGVLAVVNSARFPRLSELDLEGEQPAKFGWPALFADPGLKRLVALRLGTGVPMALVASCRNLTSLRELAVNSSHIVDADAEALLANPALAKLTKLEMYGMNWGRPRLSKSVEKRLRERFGEKALEYSPEEK